MSKKDQQTLKEQHPPFFLRKTQINILISIISIRENLEFLKTPRKTSRTALDICIFLHIICILCVSMCVYCVNCVKLID